MRQEQTTVHSRREDRIGALPDEILELVLSFLPAEEAVQTCVLARRWRHLWRSMPALRVIRFGRSLKKQGVNKLNRLVNSLLLLRDHRVPLDLCKLIICPSDMRKHKPQIKLWIRHALSLCQAEVRVATDGDHFKLNSLPLISQRLTRLLLSGLKLEGDFLDFSSCPALENLWMRGCSIHAEKISSQSLKQLTMIKCGFDFWRGNIRVRTRIFAPCLVTLELTDNYDRAPVLESMPLLVKAFVRLDKCFDFCGKEEFGGLCYKKVGCENCVDNGVGSRECVLLKGLSMAESLELVAEPAKFVFKRDLLWCPTFTKLKTLLLTEWCVEIDFSALICFLQHTPVLEKLTLQLIQAPDNWVEKKGGYDPSKQPFASKKLKVVEVKCHAFDKRVHRIFKILSTYGKYLEQINLQLTENDSGCYSFQTDKDIPW